MTMSLIGAGSDEVAAYQLGRQAAEVESANRRAVRSLFAPRVANVDVNALVGQNQALARDNANLRSELEELQRQLDNYRHNYSKLSAWADQASEKLRQRNL